MVSIEARRRAVRITHIVYPACPPEMRVSIGWPSEDTLVCRVMRDGRYDYRTFVVEASDDDTVATILAWLDPPR